jgi:hypothetical protein
MSERLAIEGGSPVRQKSFPSWPIWDEREEKRLLEVLHSGNWGMLAGTKVHAFEMMSLRLALARWLNGYVPKKRCGSPKTCCSAVRMT